MLWLVLSVVVFVIDTTNACLTGWEYCVYLCTGCCDGYYGHEVKEFVVCRDCKCTACPIGYDGDSNTTDPCLQVDMQMSQGWHLVRPVVTADTKTNQTQNYSGEKPVVVRI